MTESSGLACPPVTAGSIGSARAAAFAWCDLGGDDPPGDCLGTWQWQLSGPWCGPDDHAEPAAADIPAVDTDLDPGELVAAQLPQIVLHRRRSGPRCGCCCGS